MINDILTLLQAAEETPTPYDGATTGTRQIIYKGRYFAVSTLYLTGNFLVSEQTGFKESDGFAGWCKTTRPNLINAAIHIAARIAVTPAGWLAEIDREIETGLRQKQLRDIFETHQFLSKLTRFGVWVRKDS